MVLNLFVPKGYRTLPRFPRFTTHKKFKGTFQFIEGVPFVDCEGNYATNKIFGFSDSIFGHMHHSIRLGFRFKDGFFEARYLKHSNWETYNDLIVRFPVSKVNEVFTWELEVTERFYIVTVGGYTKKVSRESTYRLPFRYFNYLWIGSDKCKSPEKVKLRLEIQKL